MSSLLLLVIVIASAMVALFSFWLIWENRASEAMIGLLTRAIAPILLSAGLISLELLSGELKEKWTLDVVLVVRSDGYLLVFSEPLARGAAGHAEGYASLETAWAERGDQTGGRLTPDLLQYGFWHWFSAKYRNHWDVQRYGATGVSGRNSETKAALGSEVEPLSACLPGHTDDGWLCAAIPTKSTIDWIQQGNSRLIRIANRQLELRVETIEAGASSGFNRSNLAREIQNHLPVAGGSWKSLYGRIEMSVEYSWLSRWSPRTMRQRRWMEELRDLSIAELSWSATQGVLLEGLGLMEEDEELEVISAP